MYGWYLLGYGILTVLTGLVAMIRMAGRYERFDIDGESYEIAGETIPVEPLFYSTLVGVFWPLFWLIYGYVKVRGLVS